jgi:hypothetical protein
MNYLHTVNDNPSTQLYALFAQERLLQAHATGATLPYGGGISAMPSLHVAMAVLYAAVGWRVSRLAGILLSAYVLVVRVGAVHLGWHYAVDGYVSVALAVLIWNGAGWLLKRCK